MFVAGFVGFSGSGKTTLIEYLLREFAARGLRCSVIKHAHHGFELDRQGKDSWRHRKAGAHEVLVASPHLLALQRETQEPREYELGDLLRRLDAVDWVFVEGFRNAPIPKIEVWRADAGKPLALPEDPRVLALATDAPPPSWRPGARQAGAADETGAAPDSRPRVLLDLQRPGSIADWLMENRQLFVSGQ